MRNYTGLIKQVQHAKLTATGAEWTRLHRVESELALAAGHHESTVRLRARAKKRKAEKKREKKKDKKKATK